MKKLFAALFIVPLLLPGVARVPATFAVESGISPGPRDDAPRIAVIVWDGMPREFLVSPKFAPLFNSEVRPGGAFVPAISDADGCSQTLTPSAHATLSTGTCQTVAFEGDQHASMPLLTELLRQQWALGLNDVAVLSGKYRLRMLDCSDHPSYGAPFAAYFDYRLDAMGYDGDDSQVTTMVTSYVSQYHPQAMWIDFAETDRVGHKCLGVWERFLQAMQTTDVAVRDMVAYLRSEGFDYIVITTDHGRHRDEMRSHGPGTGHSADCSGCLLVYAQLMVKGDTSWIHSVGPDQLTAIRKLAAYGQALFDCMDSDGVAGELLTVGGWMNHGDDCSRCEDVWFWITGPGIVNGDYSGISARPLDLLPTLAWVCDFDSPFDEGEIISAILQNPPMASINGPEMVSSSWSRLKQLYR